MDELNTVADGLNTLLASYTEPCTGDCSHSQCPLLRELHALRIKATLEKARLTVKPTVDRELQAEQIGDLMDMRLDSATPRATAADIERERIIAMADALEYELPNYEQMRGVETLRKKLQAEFPRATGETTVEGCLAELREMFPLPHDLRIALSDYGRVINAEIYRDARLMAKGSTLADCMAQVRAAARTKAESGDATRTEGEGEKL
jgi:hypothetical protein